jgi:hypothetical protein
MELNFMHANAGGRYGPTLKLHKLIDCPYEYVLPVSPMRSIAHDLPGRVA